MERKAIEGYVEGGYSDDAYCLAFLGRMGERVRTIRALTSLTAEQVERLAGLEPGIVGDIESGAVECDGHTLLAMADAMGVTAEFLADVGGGDPFERYGRVARFMRAQRERVTARAVPVYRQDNLPREIVDGARTAFRGTSAK